MKKQLLSVAMVGLLGLGLTGCGTQENEESAAESTTNETHSSKKKEETEETSSSEKKEKVKGSKNTESRKEQKNMIFAGFIGSDRDITINAEYKEKLEKNGYIVMDLGNDKYMVITACYDGEHQMYNNIYAYQEYTLEGGLYSELLGNMLCLMGEGQGIYDGTESVNGKPVDRSNSINQGNCLTVQVNSASIVLKTIKDQQFYIQYNQQNLIKGFEALQQGKIDTVA